mgnify:CR=1 FL=1
MGELAQHIATRRSWSDAKGNRRNDITLNSNNTLQITY